MNQHTDNYFGEQLQLFPLHFSHSHKVCPKWWCTSDGMETFWYS